ncbi:retrovirus-related pol polyprotein from transposon TNT 1-94 [Tanacetum coccineum]
MTEPSWIDAMQEEIHEFERLQVWELVSCPDKVMLIKLKWIYKVETGEFSEMMGQMSFLLGIQISQSPRGIFLNQSKYASKIIKKYGMLTSDSVDTPMVEKSKLDEDLQEIPVDVILHHNMVGSLMYLTSSRPDLIYAVCLCARWSSKKQKSTAISSTEVEYIALSGCCAQIIWMRSKLTDYGSQFNKIPLYCDNKSAIALRYNNVQHLRVKHIDVRYHFIKQQMENRIVELYFVWTEYQLANIFTKPLPRERFNFLIEKLGMRSMSLETLKRLTDINGKKDILVIVDDYSRFTWVKFLASKDEARDFIIKFLKMIQVRLNTLVRNIRTDNGTEFVNQTLRSYYESVGISHETSVARSPQQNGVFERPESYSC